MKRVDVRRLLTFCIWGSGNVIQISDTSPASKKEAISSILVRRNATLAMPSCTDCLAPVHIRAPLMSTPMKLRSANFFAMPTAYSPLPQPSSRTMGLSFLKNSVFHFPFNGNGPFCNSANGYWNTLGNVSISPNFFNLFLPIMYLLSAYFYDFFIAARHAAHHVGSAAVARQRQ